MSSRRATPTDAPTREEFSALETARSKLDGELFEEIKILQTAPPPPPSTSSLAPGVTADSSCSSSALSGKWNSEEAVFPGGKAPIVSSDARIQAPGRNDTLEQPRSFTIKPDELGTFDGVPEDTALFLANIEAIRATESDPSWEKALLRALPRTLRGPDRLWFASLTESERSSNLKSLTALISAIGSTFKPATNVVRRQARDRCFRPDEEDLVYYSFVKAVGDIRPSQWLPRVLTCV
ncbi:hypothetical protein CF326_g9902 [Tilletia indica]|nr:hypothetical protein CF326_g9902 [Tilletia indica]